MTKSEFLVKAEQRRDQREARKAAEANAHVAPWHAVRAEQEAATVRSSVERQRELTGATGVPEIIGRKPVLVTSRRADNPLITDGQHRAIWEKEVADAERDHRRPEVDVAQIWVDENAIGRLGALARIKRPRRKFHHEQAAQRFKAAYEARYGSAGGAVDPSREPVDTSPIAHDSGMAARIDASDDLRKVETRLTPAIYSRLIGHIVLAVPCEEYARVTPSGQPNKRDVERAVKWLLMTLELVAAIWGMRPLPA